MSPNRMSLDPAMLLAHDRFLRSLARSLLFDEHSADDAVQAAWLAAVERGPDRPGALRAWLARVTRNQAIRIARSSSRRRAREQAASRREAIPATAEVLEREAARRRVVEAVLVLDEPYRATLLLRYLDGLPPREVARRLGVPVETVRTRVRHALQILRSRLDEEHGGDRRRWCLALAPLAAPGAPEASAPAGVASASPTGAGILTAGKIAIALTGLALVASLAWWGAGRPQPLAEGPEGTPVVPVLAAALGATSEPESESAAAAAASADEASAAPETGSLAVRVEWSDGAPAAGIHVQLATWRGQHPFRRRWVGPTGPDGRALAANLPPGTWSVRSDRAGSASVDVVAGEPAAATLRIPQGFTVEGTVVDPDGEPVEGADVWLSASSTQDEGLFVATTGPAGDFRLRDVASQHHIAARAPGFAPSHSRWLEANVGSTVRVRLQLLRARGALGGRVTDASGEPVSGAIVWACAERRSSHQFEDGYASNQSIPLVVQTGRDGRFGIADLGAGIHRIDVRAEGLAPWSEDVEILEGTTAERSITLLDGVTLTGTVCDAAGAPVPFAYVGVRAAPELVGPERGGSELLDSSATADEEGAFRLTGLAPGSFVARADSESSGRAEAAFAAGPGAAVHWDAVLSFGLVIRGRLVDAGGAPLGGWRVSVRHGRDAASFSGGTEKTDDAGHFAIRNLEDVPYQLSVMEPPTRLFPALTIEDVRPGGAEIAVRIPQAGRATVHAEGTLVGPDDEPLAGVEVRFSRTDSMVYMKAITEVDGRFRFGPVACGDYALRIQDRAHGYWIDFRHALTSPGMTWDLGRIRLDQPGHVIAMLRRDDGSALVGGRARVHLDGTDVVLSAKEETAGGGRRIGPLLPGRYRLRFSAFNALRRDVTVDVGAGEERALEVVLEPGADVFFSFPLPAPSVQVASLQLSVTDRVTGALVESVRAFPDQRGHVGVRVTLPVGSYRYNAVADSGLTAEGTFTIADLEKRLAPIFATLR